jgi:flagellar hook-basal body complex protein FliE
MGGAAGMGGIAKTPGMGQLPTGTDGAEGGGQSFGDMLKEFVVDRPTETQTDADRLAADFAAGKDIDPQTLAIATAKAGIEVQMSTRTISQGVQAVRTLLQMQI